ncbi:MAG TPA: YtxH domain-containing protein [Candidatus Alistipes faecavium]|nr:YtxH domain-containing protein [Candidatus Alistipes faecavium]
MKNSGIVIASLLGGMLIGSAITMLLTPQSGPELRRKIKDLVNDELDRVQDKIGEVEERIDEIRCQCEEK